MTDKIEGYGVGDVSDDLRAWTEQVAAILNTLITTADIADHAVTYVKLQQMVALSILGNATNATADAAEIVAAANDVLLRRTSNTLNFGGLTVGMIADSLITYAKIQNATALSVLGRSSNSGGVLADIVAGADDRLLARTASAIAFVQLTLGMVPDALLTFAKLQNADAVSVLGRSANSSGVLDEIAASADDQLLRRTGSALNFGGLTIGMFADALITYAKINDATACSILGRSANSSGVLADIAASTNDRLLARVSNALSFVQLTAGMVPNSLITNAMRADMAAATISGRASGAGTGVPTDLSASQVLAILGFNLPVHATAVAASGTAIPFTGIPSWVKKITIMFAQLSLNGTDNILIQIGDSGGLATTGYSSSSTTVGGGAADLDSSTAGFLLRNTIAAAGLGGTYVLTLLDSSTNLWSGSGGHDRDSTRRSAVGGGYKALSGTLDRLSLIPSGANSFDGGTVSIRYEQ